MFDFGFSELLLCFIVALVVLGPERLPKVARTVGRWAGQARGYMRNLTAELDRESQLSELKQQLEEAQRLVNDQQRAVRNMMEKYSGDVTNMGNDIKAVTQEPPVAEEQPAVQASDKDDVTKP